MKEKSNIGDVLSVSLEKLKTLVDSSVIIGDPIRVDNVVIIPFSKVNYGFGAGGTDIPCTKSQSFGGGSGGGVTVTPIGFLTVCGDEVKMIQPKVGESSAADKIIDMLPDISSKLGGIINSLKSKDKE